MDISSGERRIALTYLFLKNNDMLMSVRYDDHDKNKLNEKRNYVSTMK